MPILNNKNLLKLFSLLAFLIIADAADAVQMSGDSRVKTIVFDDNDVYTINAQAGFQTDIELAPNEVIDTMSVGDSYGWQITPAVHRVFIKPLQKTGITNLSVITNHHTYQFELIATPPGSRDSHAYVVKFFYPDQSHNAQPMTDRTRNSMRPVSATAVPELSNVNPMPMPPTPPITVTSNNSAPAPASNGMNYNYTLTGPDAIAPIKVYDDGHTTYFEFKNSPVVKIASISPDGNASPVNGRVDSPNHVAVDVVAAKFLIMDQSNNIVTVYNETMKLPQIPSARSN